MKCILCKRKAKYTPTKNGCSHSEPFYSISWKKVNKKEYEQRKSDGRTLLITGVCPECITKYEGRPPLGLHDLNKIRERNITKDEYYKEHGY